MINRLFLLLALLAISACGNINLLLVDERPNNKFKNNTFLILKDVDQQIFAQEVFSFFGNNKNGEYIVAVSFSEKKENRLVKQNQVAEKIDYELKTDFEVFYRNTNCNFFNTNTISKFSFVPKSFGYNFGTDRSFEKLYRSTIKESLKNFLDSVPEKISCDE